MKLFTSISCLLLGINIVNCSLANNLFEWSRQLSKFTRGLKVENSVGEFVEVTIDSLPPRIKGLFNSTKVQFFLHTRQNPGSPVQLVANDQQLLNGSNFDSNKHTYFVTHGWMGDKKSRSCTFIPDELLKKNDSNVIVVDWGSIASSDYGTARVQVRDVAREVARMIDYLRRVGSLKPTRTTLIGHCMGAHVMGIAGLGMQDPIGAIIGLDPAYPLFVDYSPSEGITDNDALHVQIIHTDPGFLGIPKPRGHTNYFVNGSHLEPGCGSDQFHACSHSRAVNIFGESINSACGFCAVQCKTAGTLEPEECSPACLGSTIADLGNHGVYYLDAKPQAENDSCTPEKQSNS